MQHVTLILLSARHDRPKRIRFPTVVWRCILVLPLLLALGVVWLTVDRFSIVSERASLRGRVEQLEREATRVGMLEQEVARLSRVAYLLENITGSGADDAALQRYRTEARLLLGITEPGDSGATLESRSTDGEDAVPALWPVRGPVTAEFGGKHTGIDIAAPRGTPVRAAASGVVAEATTDSILGFVVVVNHRDGYATLYGHNSHLVVVPGQNVGAGEVVGFVGSSGRSTGPHLHYEVMRNGERLDPRLFLPDAP
jgi:murein DD-endopeptidase MepM/ murein hydrolase activator NlpD